MKVRDVMSKRVYTVTPDMPLKAAGTRMLEYGVSGLPVVDGESVVGVISETDILFKERVAPDRKGVVDWLMHYGEDPPLAKLDARTVGEAMSTPAVTIASGRSVADAASLLLDLRIDRLPVVDGDRLVGIVTRADLVRAFTRDDAEIEGEILRGGVLQRLWVDPHRIDVKVEQGNVVLEGEIETRDLAQSLVEFARRTPGVVSVESRLTCPSA
jgi:CBS domain-containing protein